MTTQTLVSDGTRYIAFHHRVKKTKAGEARPTTVTILRGATSSNHPATNYSLKTEDDELDFVYHRFPVTYRSATAEDDLSKFNERHIIFKKLEKFDTGQSHPANLVKKINKNQYQVATKVPESYDGVETGDRICILLGGSGGKLTIALDRRCDKVGAKMFQISWLNAEPAIKAAEALLPDVPAEVIAQEEEPQDSGGVPGKSDNKPKKKLPPFFHSSILATLVRDQQELFYEVAERDRDLIMLREILTARNNTMGDRMACEQRLFEQLKGAIYCSEEGGYEEGSIPVRFLAEKANNKGLKVLIEEEESRNRELAAACNKLEVYKNIFEPIVGVGPAISARVIAGIIDIRRFKNPWKLRAYCGVHLLKDGRFPRRRSGQPANWQQDCRQALYLFGDQMVYRPESLWGHKLLRKKASLKVKHPEPVKNPKNGKKMYTDGHLHKMAYWFVLGRFVEHIFWSWWDLAKKQNPNIPGPTCKRRNALKWLSGPMPVSAKLEETSTNEQPTCEKMPDNPDILNPSQSEGVAA